MAAPGTTPRWRRGASRRRRMPRGGRGATTSRTIRARLSLLVSHPDYVSDSRWQEAQKAAGLTMAMLRKGTATLALKRGIIVRGRVTDPAGKPIKDALVVQGDDP